MTPAQATEIKRLTNLVATARCRRLAIALGKAGPQETEENTSRRLWAAEEAFNNYLKSLTKEEPNENTTP